MVRVVDVVFQRERRGVIRDGERCRCSRLEESKGTTCHDEISAQVQFPCCEESEHGNGTPLSFSLERATEQAGGQEQAVGDKRMQRDKRDRYCFDV